ncbi:MAG TPA: hypothetical protein VFJ91_00770 [Gaiellaceae bacterium]|nr:hypothetical protein [Gaiellaceae bacterium]
MTASTVSNILAEVEVELRSAQRRHAPMHSPHEGHSVIREEFDELWEHVRADTGRTPAARAEAIQLAAMACRYVHDLCGGDGV